MCVRAHGWCLRACLETWLRPARPAGLSHASQSLSEVVQGHIVWFIVPNGPGGRRLHGIGDWGWLEEMLGWYLRANDGDTHCAIVAAFIDVVVDIADPAREACSSEASSCTFAAGELDVAEKGKPAAVFTVSCLD